MATTRSCGPVGDQPVWICRADKAWTVITPVARRPGLDQPGATARRDGTD